MGGRDLSAVAVPEERASWKTDRVELAGWIVLGLLLLATLVAALTFDREGRPGLVGDEATYAMQAASLAWDFDLVYTRADYDRFVEHWGGPPDGLILQKREGGSRLVYGKPFLYALVTAPFVRVAPVRGALVANALLLAGAAFLAARALRTRVGSAAPFYVAVFLFASVAFAYTFWVHVDTLLLATTAAGFALVYGGDRGSGERGRRPLTSLYEGEVHEPEGHLFWRYLAAGALLAVPVAVRPVMAAFWLPVLFAVPRHRRIKTLLAFAVGTAVVFGVTALAQWAAGGPWTGYGGLRQGFNFTTGYPEVKFPASDFEKQLVKSGNTSWLQEGAIEIDWSARLWGWDALYFLVGRNVGVLPYFLPLLLAFASFRKDRGRWALPLAALAVVLFFFALRPFNFYGGGGAIANRYFLPLYPALWFMAARPGKVAGAFLAAAASAPFLWQLWLSPTAFPVGEDGRYHHVTEVAERWLPYETTQSHIPGGQDVAEHGLWIKLLNHNVYRTTGGDLRIVGDLPGEILVGSPTPLGSLRVELGKNAPSRLEIGGEVMRPDVLRPSGAVSFSLPLTKPRAVHPMWWTRDDYYLYQLDFRLPGAPAEPIALSLHPGRGR